MIFGSATVIGLVIWINKSQPMPAQVKSSAFQSIQLRKVTNIAPKIARRSPQERPKPDRPPLPSFKGLASSLSGIDVGLPAFHMDDLSDLNNALLNAAGDDVVMTGATVDKPPTIRRQVPLDYPEKAKAQGLEGYVLLNLLIDKDGRIRKVKILDSKPAAVFDAYAREGIRAWEFEPATYQGKHVKVWVQQKIRFNLS